MRRAGYSYIRFVLAHSASHRRHLRSLAYSPEAAARYARLAGESLVAQRETEAADAVPFETFRQQYLALPG